MAFFQVSVINFDNPFYELLVVNAYILLSLSRRKGRDWARTARRAARPLFGRARVRSWVMRSSPPYS